MNKLKFLKKLIIIYKNKDKIPEWRYKYIQSLGFSSYHIYQIELLLRGEGIIQNNNQIDWDKLLQLINNMQQEIAAKYKLT